LGVQKKNKKNGLCVTVHIRMGFFFWLNAVKNKTGNVWAVLLKVKVHVLSEYSFFELLHVAINISEHKLT
jgi:hypothetical protein